ncbi:MAG TPA: DUF296 domain-containing protein [Phycisphaerae bacterium]|nr:DUF296 domain-containing protein [Phycisphaerae bacterium]
MEYGIGRIGRVIVARGFDGEKVYDEIESLAAKENIRCGAVVLIGGLKSGKVVVGPKDPARPDDPLFREFSDAREIAGVGTLFCDETGRPKLHLHGAIGRGGEVIAGCPRGGATVYCLLEVIIFEIDGVDAARRLDPKSGLRMLTLGR